MTRVILQMIVLGFLLIFINQAFLFSCSDAARGSKCVSDEEMRSRTDKLLRKYWDKLGVSDEILHLQPTRTCPQTAKEMHGDLSNRSLSPWRYRMDHDGNRFPATIAFAECLCDGCIINRHEDLSYNSVLVYSPMMILKKTPCQNDSKKYVVKKDFIKVPVSCTCTVPKYAK